MRFGVRDTTFHLPHGDCPLISTSPSRPTKCQRTLLLAICLLNLLVAGCSKGIHTTTETQSVKPAACKEEGAANRSLSTEQIIHIDNFTYDPAEVTVQAGTKVTWINRDDVPHTATSSAKPRVFDSKALDTDETFSFIFDKPGTYEYFCAVHPKMTGRVIVK
jgi:plastocyanin